MTPIYEDNHIIIVLKAPGEIVQGDKTGDKPLVDMVKDYLKEKHNKPGNVFCGVVHRIDRPVSGLVIFAKTSKALTRLNEMLRKSEIKKTYWAVVEGIPSQHDATLRSFLISNQRLNKTFMAAQGEEGAKEAILHYSTLFNGDKYSLVEINLQTGRKHQIRCQLSASGHPIKGDLKYGARRSNPDGSISLQAHRLEFRHPVSHEWIDVEAPPTKDMLPFLK